MNLACAFRIYAISLVSMFLFQVEHRQCGSSGAYCTTIKSELDKYEQSKIKPRWIQSREALDSPEEINKELNAMLSQARVHNGMLREAREGLIGEILTHESKIGELETNLKCKTGELDIVSNQRNVYLNAPQKKDTEMKELQVNVAEGEGELDVVKTKLDVSDATSRTLLYHVTSSLAKSKIGRYSSVAYELAFLRLWRLHGRWYQQATIAAYNKSFTVSWQISITSQ